MNYIRNSILATIIYYDIFDYPLTPMEVYKFLINPGRITRPPQKTKDISLGVIFQFLGKLVRSGLLEEKNGFYFLPGRSSLYELRIEKTKIAAQKWKKILRYCYWLQLAPYLRGIFASGSLAMSNTEIDSDLDVLIISESKRLYTNRFFVWFLSTIMGVRRKKDQKVAPDKLCFNHYITSGELTINHQSLFNAQTYINLKPILIDEEMIDRFYNANLWLNNYAYNFKVQKHFARRSVKRSKILKKIARFGELIMTGSVGDKIELLLKNIQQKIIAQNPVTYESGGRIIYTDDELEFHPRSFESLVVEKYNKTLTKYGIIPFVRETDSGLSY